MKYLTPHRVCKSLSELDPVQLRKMCINHVLFDMDGTLASHNTFKLHQSCKPALSAFTKEFGDNLWLLTNTPKVLDKQWEGIRLLRTQSKKPFNASQIFASIKQHDNRIVSPMQICIIGDRLLTDVLTGRLGGFNTVLVQGLDKPSWQLHGPALFAMLQIEQRVRGRLLIQ